MNQIHVNIPTIKWFNNGDKTIEDLDKLTLQRFNIKNLKTVDDYKNMKNFYVFKVLDLDENSETGYYGMCINKEYAKAVKDALNNWKNKK